MEYVSQERGIRSHEMTKLVLISIKAVILLLSTWMVAPFMEMLDQASSSTPPIMMYYAANILIWTHEFALLLKPVRITFLEGMSRRGRADVKQIIAVWFSLMCIRMFCIGKLNEIWYPESAFSSETYYQLMALITLILGITATSNIIQGFRNSR